METNQDETTPYSGPRNNVEWMEFRKAQAEADANLVQPEPGTVTEAPGNTVVEGNEGG